MSYRIEYQWGAFHVPPALSGLPSDRFVVAIQGGDNNLYDSATNRRARSWDVCMIGTAEQVLKKAVYYAGCCEGGGLQPHGRCCSPESYIRRIRRLIEGPEYFQRGCWFAKLCVDINHAISADVRGMGAASHTEKRYGQERLVVPFEMEQYPLYFDLIDKYGFDLPAWCFAEIGGLP